MHRSRRPSAAGGGLALAHRDLQLDPCAYLSPAAGRRSKLTRHTRLRCSARFWPIASQAARPRGSASSLAAPLAVRPHGSAALRDRVAFTRPQCPAPNRSGVDRVVMVTWWASVSWCELEGSRGLLLLLGFVRFLGHGGRHTGTGTVGLMENCCCLVERFFG
jgi:hypothetical protein